MTTDTRQFRLTTDVVIGIVLVLVGLLFALENFDVLEASDILRYWPILLVVFGGVKALQPGNMGSRMFGGAIAFVGVMMLLDRADIIHFSWTDLWPLLLVAAGLAIAMRHGRGLPSGELRSGGDGRLQGSALLGGLELRSQANPFRGGSISATLGGAEINLHDAVIPEGETVELDIFAFMGGVELRVPDAWRVDASVTSILAGVENRAKEPVAVNAPCLLLRGTTIMGGIEIRN